MTDFTRRIVKIQFTTGTNKWTHTHTHTHTETLHRIRPNYHEVSQLKAQPIKICRMMMMMMINDTNDWPKIDWSIAHYRLYKHCPSGHVTAEHDFYGRIAIWWAASWGHEEVIRPTTTAIRWALLIFPTSLFTYWRIASNWSISKHLLSISIASRYSSIETNQISISTYNNKSGRGSSWGFHQSILLTWIICSSLLKWL